MQKFIIFLLITLLSEVFVRAQQTTSNPDLIFKKAKHLAFNNQWKEARETARVILRLDDHYQDARILIGRTYAWEHQFDSARFVIMQVLAADSSYRDAIDALTDIEFWAG